jgi:hypothetical protein
MLTAELLRALCQHVILSEDVVANQTPRLTDIELLRPVAVAHKLCEKHTGFWGLELLFSCSCPEPVMANRRVPQKKMARGTKTQGVSHRLCTARIGLSYPVPTIPPHMNLSSQSAAAGFPFPFLLRYCTSLDNPRVSSSSVSKLAYCDLHNNRPKTAETSAIRVS